jgi:integrase
MLPRTSATQTPHQPTTMAPVSGLSPADTSVPVSLNAQRILSAGPLKPPEPLSQKEYALLLAAAERLPDSDDLKDALVILYHTGLRAGELCQLRWIDVMFDQHLMVINSRKTGQRRRVPFASKVLQVLQARRRRDPGSTFVLGKIPKRSLKRVVNQLATVSSSVRKSPTTLRTLRVTFITRWCNAGGNLEELGHIAGISSPFGRFQSLASPEHLFDAAGKFQAQLEESDE